MFHSATDSATEILLPFVVLHKADAIISSGGGFLFYFIFEIKHFQFLPFHHQETTGDCRMGKVFNYQKIPPNTHTHTRMSIGKLEYFLTSPYSPNGFPRMKGIPQEPWGI